MAPERLRVHLGHDERHLGGHAEGAGVVHDYRTPLHRLRRECKAPLGAGAEERDVNAVERPAPELLDGAGRTVEGHAAARRARGGKQPNSLDRKPVLLQHTQHLGADRARSTNHGHVVSRRHGCDNADNTRSPTSGVE